jgi:hypothetical protein
MARPFRHETFWDRVEKHITIDENGCHLFTGCLNHDGYGRIGKDGKNVYIHREVFKKHNPEIEMTGVIMHTCDKPNCVNPEHLKHGTVADNVADMVAKGRRVTVKGSNQPDAKLHEKDIPAIRLRLQTNESCTTIGRDYNVSASAIRNIEKSRTWTHVK